MFAEAAVVCMTMEHFVRIVLGSAEALLWNLLKVQHRRIENRSLLFRDPDGNLVNLFTPVTAEAIKKFDNAQ